MVSENASGYLDVDNSAMTYILINAVKELADHNEKLQEQLKKQGAMLEELANQVAAMQARQGGPAVEHAGKDN